MTTEATVGQPAVEPVAAVTDEQLIANGPTNNTSLSAGGVLVGVGG